MPVVVEPSAYPTQSAQRTLATAAQPLLQEVPRLVGYRAEADPDADFIPKTIAGFALGFMLFGACATIATLMAKHAHDPSIDLKRTIAIYLAFLVGIDGVAASLLLVGLKVRADHAAEDLFARHWLNSIGTGALHALIIAGPALLLDQGIIINRFVASGIFMMVMAFPAVAAKWTVGPQPRLARPGE
jgi:hypothetical protein